MAKNIGKVMATEKSPTTIDKFCFWTKSDLILSPFDVICVEHIDNSVTYGVIEEISHITDSMSFLSNYLSSDFGDVSSIANTNRLSMNVVSASVLGNTKDYYIPVHEGSIVRTASADEILDALGLKKIKNPVVAGYLEMYSASLTDKIILPVELNSDYLIGPEGAHLNISGISGLAAKTSYAMFLMNSLQQIPDNKSTAYIIFNVKGNDLLAIDEPANNEHKVELQKEYENLGLDAKPFNNVKYFYPGGFEGSVNSYVPSEQLEKQKSAGKAFTYRYTYEEHKKNLDLLFATIDDSTQTMDSILNHIATHREFGQTNAKWDDFIEVLDKKCQAGQQSVNEIAVGSWRKFARITRKIINGNPLFAARLEEQKQDRDLNAAIVSLRKGETLVIDIAKLAEDEQSFVFGSAMKAINELKLTDKKQLEEEGKNKAETIPGRVVVFVDELNKYASSDLPKNSPIVRLLLDIAERGRSLGIVLFSAEQFKSAIHDRVKGNCSTHAYGRTNVIEISKSDYRFIPSVYKNMMTRLNQGEYIVQNPLFRSVLKLKFPLPCYKQFKNK